MAKLQISNFKLLQITSHSKKRTMLSDCNNPYDIFAYIYIND